MAWKRRTGVLPAIGSVTAAIALLTGLPGAYADEVSQLRANQDILQQRIDQLAQGNPGAGNPLAASSNPASGAAMAGGSFPRSFLIPGTDTSIRIGGQVDLTADYWLSGGPANASPQTTTVASNGQLPATPLDVHGQRIPGTAAVIVGTGGFGNVAVQNQHSRGHVFSMSARESRLSVETRTPTAYGEARTYLEFDFAGCNNFSCASANHVANNLVPRLRHAYGTLGGILAGQANSNFRDADAGSDTLDFGGTVGAAGVVRLPQIRYTQPIPTFFLGGAVSMSLEAPETDVASSTGLVFSDTNASGTPAGPNPAGIAGSVSNNFTKATAPDITFAYYVPQPWGHVQFSAVARDLDIQDGKFLSREFVGWGLNLSGDVKPRWFGWDRDYITWSVTGGQGIGRYLNQGGDIALATNLASTGAATVCTAPGAQPINVTAAACFGPGSASNVIVKPITAFGGTVSYQHRWMPNLRSNIAFGILHQDVPSNLIGATQSAAVNKELISTHLNLIWNPVAFVDLGVEYVWGHRVTVGNLKGDLNTVLGKMRVRF